MTVKRCLPILQEKEIISCQIQYEGRSHKVLERDGFHGEVERDAQLHLEKLDQVAPLHVELNDAAIKVAPREHGGFHSHFHGTLSWQRRSEEMERAHVGEHEMKCAHLSH